MLRGSLNSLPPLNWVSETYYNLTQSLPSWDTQFAIAYSGGGDSTALLHALRNHPGQSLALIVDHGLRPDSKAEAQAAKNFASLLGYDARILTWKSMKSKGVITTGVQEKARCARYRLMGDFCRREGIGYLVTGHTRDDQAETLYMRYDRKTDWRGACGMRMSRYAPLWPELAEVTVLRPMLNASRSELREYNRSNLLPWVEDPSNFNFDYSRIQARHILSESPHFADIVLEPVQELQTGFDKERQSLRAWSSANMIIHKSGYIRFKCLPPVEVLFQSLLAVSGRGGPIDRSKIRALRRKMRSPDFRASTLAGSKVEAYNKGYLLSRDPVSVKGRRGRPSLLGHYELTDNPYIWDGRYKVKSKEPSWSLRPAYQLTPTLPKNLARTLKQIPASVRATLPVVFDPQGQARAIGPFQGEGVTIESLVRKRLCHINIINSL